LSSYAWAEKAALEQLQRRVLDLEQQRTRDQAKLEQVCHRLTQLEQQVQAGSAGASQHSIREFAYADLETATDNFSVLIGGGKFGGVYRATLSDGTLAAVKRLEQESPVVSTAVQLEAEWRVLHRFPHPRLVQLLGLSHDQAPCLVYPLMSCSLDQRLQADPPLSLAERLRIAAHVAEGLAHVHSAVGEVQPQPSLLRMAGMYLIIFSFLSPQQTGASGCQSSQCSAGRIRLCSSR
jgi:hypothetical protein